MTSAEQDGVTGWSFASGFPEEAYGEAPTGKRQNVMVNEWRNINVLTGFYFDVKHLGLFKSESNGSFVDGEATPKVRGKAMGLQQTGWNGLHREFWCFPNKEQSEGHLVMVTSEVIRSFLRAVFVRIVVVHGGFVRGGVFLRVVFERQLPSRIDGLIYRFG
jgi:hypothetical protein